MKKGEFCEFCDILDGRHRRTSQIIAQNEEFFAFHDVDDASAVAHVLVCTKEHIESALHVKDPAQLLRMRAFGRSVLTDLHPKYLEKKAKNDPFRFGFHVPPLISVYHVHLHAFILPFKSKIQQMRKYTFGGMFKSVQQMMQLWREKARL